MKDRDPAEVATPPFSLIQHAIGLNLEGCRCPWQYRPRTGWVRLSDGKGCPHHDLDWQRGHFTQALRALVPADWQPSGEAEATAVVGQIRRLLWGDR